MGTLIVSLTLLLIVGLIILYMVRQRKKGVCSGCKSCSGACPHHREPNA